MDSKYRKLTAELFAEGYNDGLLGLPSAKDDPYYMNGYREGRNLYNAREAQ